jgi:hypothetical protein
VSLSWRDVLRVSLAPHGLRIARHRRGWRSPAAETFDVAVAATVAGDAPWAAAVDTLEQTLQTPRLRGADLDVTLDGVFARWLLLPWSAALATDAERLAYALLEFESVHGERARAWRVRLGDARPGEPSPACAIDEALHDRLAGVATVAGGRLVAARPAFGAALDRHRRVLTAPSAAFALVERGRCTIAAFERGRWRHLESTRIAGRVADALAAPLARIDALGVCPESPRRVHVVFDASPEMLPARVGGWDLVTADDAAPAPRARVAWGRS